MGSATRGALASSITALGATSGVDLRAGSELLAAGRIVGESKQLRSILGDPSTTAADRTSVVDAVFGSLSAPAKAVLHAVLGQRWSSSADLVAGVEEVGIRAVATSATSADQIDSELLAFGAAVASDAELELALGNKLGDAAAKASLVDALLVGKASPQTLAIVRHLVQQPRGRSIRVALSQSAAIVADAAGLAIATVTTAAPLTEAQATRLADALGTQYGRALRLNRVVDPSLIGGVRVQIGDDVIDGSIASRINDLRLQLAG